IDPDALLELVRQANEQVALLSRVGEALYGGRWQTQLARALGVSDRQMRRWVSVEADIPWSFLNEVLPPLFQAKVEKLAHVLDELIAAGERRLQAPNFIRGAGP